MMMEAGIDGKGRGGHNTPKVLLLLLEFRVLLLLLEQSA